MFNDIDFLRPVYYDVERSLASAREGNADIEALRVLAKTGEGIDDWYQ